MRSSRFLIRYPAKVENLPARVTGIESIVNPSEEQR
jgi:hypothetical protein